MKLWEKPEMLDLDAKFTENATMTISGGTCPPCEDMQAWWAENGWKWDWSWDKFLESNR